MLRPEMIFIGDYSDAETVRLLEQLCNHYCSAYNIVATGYNFNAIAGNDFVRNKCKIIGMNDRRFIYYKNIAKFVIISSPAPRFVKEKKNQEIIYVISKFDSMLFAGIIGDITAVVTDEDETYNFISNTFGSIKTVLSKSKSNGLIETIDALNNKEPLEVENYLFVMIGKNNDLRDREGTKRFLKDVSDNYYSNIIALTEEGEIEEATSNFLFRHKDRCAAVLSEFEGIIIYYDESSRVVFNDFIHENCIDIKALEVLTPEDLLIKQMEDAVMSTRQFEWSGNESNYSRYRFLIEQLYVQQECEKIKVSIIICRYNTPYNLLSRAVKSALNTGHANVEVIVVDDGSDENIENSLRNDFPDKRVQYFYKPNEGPGPARDFGVKRAKGKYIFYLDSDDTIHRNSMRCMVAHANYFDVKMVIGKRILCDENGVPRSESITQLAGDCFKCYYSEKGSHLIYLNAMINNLLIEKAFLDENNIHFQKGLYEDIEYSAHLYSLCPEYHYVNVIVHDWYQYGNNSTISSNIEAANLKERIEKENQAWNYIKEKDRKGRMMTILSVDFNRYLNAYFSSCDEERNKIWALLKTFFLEKKEYITPDLYPENLRELSKAIVQNNRYYFEYVISRYYKREATEEAFDNYIVFTHYHLYVAILRAVERKRPCRLYIGLFYASFDTSLVYRIKETGIFDYVKTFTYGNLVQELFNNIDKRPGEEDVIIPNHLYNYFSDIFKACNVDKDDIYIFSDTHPYWYYIEREFNNIIKLEDAYNSFDREIKTHEIAGDWSRIQQYEGTIFPLMFFRSEKIKKIVLSSMPEGIPDYYYDKIEIEDTKKLEKKHKDQTGKILTKIYNVNAEDFNENSTLLLTQPLAQFGYCNKKQQRKLMQKMCRGCDKEELLIKPHPADNMDYSYLGGTILPKSVPIEVYNYMGKRISKVITFGSSAIETIEFAQEKEVVFKLHDFTFEDVVCAIRDYNREEPKGKGKIIKKRIKNVIKKVIPKYSR